MLPLLLSVQAMELLWVGFNFLGIEFTTTESEVRSIADIHLSHMPFSHSVASGVGFTLIAGLILWKTWHRLDIAIAISLGILSHLILDLAVHAPDIPWMPFLEGEKMGMGYYGTAPLLALAIETIYGVFCWVVYRGNWKLLAAILGFDALAITSYTPLILGGEQNLANAPQLFAAFVAMQIAITLFLVWFFTRRDV